MILLVDNLILNFRQDVLTVYITFQANHVSRWRSTRHCRQVRSAGNTSFYHSCHHMSNSTSIYHQFDVVQNNSLYYVYITYWFCYLLLLCSKRLSLMTFLIFRSWKTTRSSCIPFHSMCASSSSTFFSCFLLKSLEPSYKWRRAFPTWKSSCSAMFIGSLKLSSTCCRMRSSLLPRAPSLWRATFGRSLFAPYASQPAPAPSHSQTRRRHRLRLHPFSSIHRHYRGLMDT